MPTLNATDTIFPKLESFGHKKVAPYCVINSGRIINCYSDLMGFGRKRTMQFTENIYEATRNILKLSKAESISTIQAANKITEDSISATKKSKIKLLNKF